MSRRGRILLRTGIVLFVVGAGPLLAIIIAASLGLTHDPNPNPVGLGMLAGITFWPAVIMIVWGVVSIRHERNEPLAAPGPHRTTLLTRETPDLLSTREDTHDDQ